MSKKQIKQSTEASSLRKRRQSAEAAAPGGRVKDSSHQLPDATTDEVPIKTRSLAREHLESAIVTMIMALFFMTFVGQVAAVPSASMQNTILVGDHFLINKFVFAPGPHLPFLPQRDVKRGDVIVFKYPAPTDRSVREAASEVEQYKTFFIKRVIGLPGETIEVRNASVLINNQVLQEHRVTTQPRGERIDKAPLKILSNSARQVEEPYSVYYDPRTINSPLGLVNHAPPGFQYAVNGQSFVIPANSYFVMGDNRDDSADSRVWGVVPRDLVVGRALFVIWSYDESAPSNGFFLIDFFRNTRWKRTGTLIR